MSKRKRNDNLQVQVEQNGTQGAVVQTVDTSTANEQLPDSILVGQPQSGDQSERNPENSNNGKGSIDAQSIPTFPNINMEPMDADKWEESLAPIIKRGVVNPLTDALTLPHETAKSHINMNEVRDLLFSIRDQGIYCPMCRYPEFAANEMRSSHFEGCSVGAMCEKLLEHYPKENYVVKWRK